MPKRNQKYFNRGTSIQLPLIEGKINGVTQDPFTVKIEQYDVGTSAKTVIPQLKTATFKYVFKFGESANDIV